MSEIEQEAEDNFTLTDALTGDTEKTEAVTEETTEETEPEKAEATEETSEETTEEKSEKKEDSPPESKDKEHWTFSQAMDQRERRQKAEHRVEELKQQLADLQPKDDEISIFNDEDGWKAQQEQKLNTTLRNEKLNMSQALAEDSLGTEAVDEAVTWFKEEAPKSAYLADRFNNAKLPFHEVVKMFKEDKARRVDPDVLRSEIKAEILAELKTESTEKEPDKTITPSIANKRSGSSNETGDVTLNSILGR